MTDFTEYVATGDIEHFPHRFTTGDQIPAAVFTDDELDGLFAVGAIATRDDLLRPLEDEITGLRTELADRELHLANLKARLAEAKA